MIRETQTRSQKTPDSWILPLSEWRKARGLDHNRRIVSKPLATEDEPPRSDEFPGWDTMIMALMA